MDNKDAQSILGQVKSLAGMTAYQEGAGCQPGYYQKGS